MKQMFSVEQALDLFYRLDDQDAVYSSSSESESGDDEIDDSAFVVHNERDDEQPGSSTTPTTSRQRPTQRGGGRKSQTRSRSPAKSGQPHHSSEPWKTESDPDTAPQTSRFMPRRTPGAQVNMHSVHSPMDLFQLYFTRNTMKTLCKNTNKQAAKKQEMGNKYKWTDVEVEELYKYLGLLMYTSLVSLPSLQDYWRKNHFMSVPFVVSHCHDKRQIQGVIVEHPPQ
ncbi:uncharacterized protein LOC143719416 [Siphateles boraxobius]|uniref:uncharacterized protein LOC143719416 n=1 Tax=Siphateles boraxobius TaxID=180520 RepID=UPI0040630FF2